MTPIAEMLEPYFRNIDGKAVDIITVALFRENRTTKNIELLMPMQSLEYTENFTEYVARDIIIGMNGMDFIFRLDPEMGEYAESLGWEPSKRDDSITKSMPDGRVVITDNQIKQLDDYFRNKATIFENKVLHAVVEENFKKFMNPEAGDYDSGSVMYLPPQSYYRGFLRKYDRKEIEEKLKALYQKRHTDDIKTYINAFKKLQRLARPILGSPSVTKSMPAGKGVKAKTTPAVSGMPLKSMLSAAFFVLTAQPLYASDFFSDFISTLISTPWAAACLIILGIVAGGGAFAGILRLVGEAIGLAEKIIGKAAVKRAERLWKRGKIEKATEIYQKSLSYGYPVDSDYVLESLRKTDKRAVGLILKNTSRFYDFNSCIDVFNVLKADKKELFDLSMEFLKHEFRVGQVMQYLSNLRYEGTIRVLIKFADEFNFKEKETFNEIKKALIALGAGQKEVFEFGVNGLKKYESRKFAAPFLAGLKDPVLRKQAVLAILEIPVKYAEETEILGESLVKLGAQEEELLSFGEKALGSYGEDYAIDLLAKHTRPELKKQAVLSIIKTPGKFEQTKDVLNRLGAQEEELFDYYIKAIGKYWISEKEISSLTELTKPVLKRKAIDAILAADNTEKFDLMRKALASLGASNGDLIQFYCNDLKIGTFVSYSYRRKSDSLFDATLRLIIELRSQRALAYLLETKAYFEKMLRKEPATVEETKDSEEKDWEGYPVRYWTETVTNPNLKAFGKRIEKIGSAISQISEESGSSDTKSSPGGMDTAINRKTYSVESE